MSSEGRRMPQPKGRMMPGMSKGVKLDKDTLKKLTKRITAKHKLGWGAVIVLIIVSVIASIQSSLFIGTLIDDYIAPLLLEDAPVFDNLFKAICQIAVIYVIGAVSTYAYNRIMINISQSVLKEIRNEMFEKMQNLPIKYFDTKSHGDIMSCYVNDIDTLRQMIAQSIPQIVSSIITIVGVFFSMLFLDISLTAIVILMVFLMLTLTGKIGGIAGKFFIAQQNDLGRMNGFVEEMINGQKVIKVFCHEEKAVEQFDKINDDLYGSSVQANTISNILMPILNNLGNIQYVVVAMVGGVMAINGINALTLGKVSAFLQLTKSFSMPINQVSQQLNSIIMALAGAKRIFDLIEEEPEVDEGDVELVNLDKKGKETSKHTNSWAWKVPKVSKRYLDDETIENDTLIDEKVNNKKDNKSKEANKNYKEEVVEYEYIPLKGHIELENVDFAYDDENLVLKNISLYAKPGQKIAFVGATGAGKTTITNLINRFYDIQKGTIKYDGIDVKRIKKQSLRQSLGMVLQDTNLFTGTIMENIRYGRPEATEEEVIAAAKLANADGFINRLPNKYDTVLTENGAQLSQGQRQLISIARAAVADAPVMILDEATSSIDTRTEKIVQDGMDKLMEGRTVLVIAHRLSTVRNAKAIMVLDHGKIIERGEHDFLIDQKGVYYRLYTGAFELE